MDAKLPAHFHIAFFVIQKILHLTLKGHGQPAPPLRQYMQAKCWLGVLLTCVCVGALTIHLSRILPRAIDETLDQDSLDFLATEHRIS